MGFQWILHWWMLGHIIPFIMGWYKYRLQTSNVWSGEESLFCIVNLFPHLCLGIGNFVVAFCFAVCCSVHSNIKLLCNKHLNFSKHSNNRLLCNRQSEFQSIQTANFCATDSLNCSLFKHQTFVQQRLNFSTFKQQTFVQQTSDFSWSFLRFSKIPKDLQSFGTAKKSNLYDFNCTEYFINFRTLGYLEIVAPCQRLLLLRDENKNPVCVP